MNALEYKIIGKAEMQRRLRNAGPVVIASLVSEMKAQMARAADWSRANRLSGDPLHRRSGQLSRSVTSGARVEGNSVIGTLGSNLPYAKVHEQGGIFNIPTYSRRPPRSKTPSGHFRKRTDEQRVASVTVRAHTATFPQRAFLRPALENNRAQILAGLRAATIRSLK